MRMKRFIGSVLYARLFTASAFFSSSTGRGPRCCVRLSTGTSSTALSSPKQHIIQNLFFDEVNIYMEQLQRDVLILEATPESQEQLVDLALNCSKGAVEEDPYGAVLWPAAKTVSSRLCELDLSGKTVLELGTGTGLVSFVATLRGAERVIASDYNPLTLAAIEVAASLQTPLPLDRTVLHTLLFDVKDLSQPLPQADYVVIADLLYDKELGNAVALRVLDAIRRKSKVIVGDSPSRMGRPFFLATLKAHGVDCSFTFLEGSTVVGHRNSLISTSAASSVSLPITMGLLEL